ncbi:hypothetical protein, conserved [Trypanosoma brucei brucei TREU927]|uniref:Uncharacterized protein n=1 Tax=Trypanosoma brucei brucei (strain 927/4 GUTat10.1) TaxID=185431 RepID=Q4GYS6_TRYB2|nr:hypothetical protein, conserved [Trypanosoma brucei brucei TREU927]CAJ16490.1 hypothetical protein, conserved [Trypanosoma brucei brucei TREU927]
MLFGGNGSHSEMQCSDGKTCECSPRLTKKYTFIPLCSSRFTMLLSIPVRSGCEANSLTVTRDRKHGTSNCAPPSVEVSPCASSFLVGDAAQIVVCLLKSPSVYQICGTVLFRQHRVGSLACCFVEPEGRWGDFGCSAVTTLTSNESKNIHIGEGSDIVYFSFMSSTEVMAVSYGACVGYMQLSADKHIIKGKSMQLDGLSNVSCACLVNELSLLVVLTERYVCGVVDIRSGCILEVVCDSMPVKLGIPSSCVLLQLGDSGTIDIMVNFPSSVEPHILTLRRKQCEPPSADAQKRVKAKHNSHLKDLTGGLCTKRCEDFSLVASVGWEMVKFLVMQKGKLRGLANFENETGTPFFSGFWAGDHFVAIRADGLVVFLSVELHQGHFDKLEISTLGSMDLISCSAALLYEQSDRFFVLAVKNMEALWNNASDAVCISDSNNARRMLKCHTAPVCPTGTVLVDTVFFRDGIALLTVESSGDCSATFLTASGAPSLLLAREKNPEDIASCLLYDQRETIFVTGHQDGTLHVWITVQLRHIVHTGHAGPVDKVVLLPEGGKRCSYGFISVCTQRGSVVVHHAETFECVCVVQAPSAPLTSLLWDPSSECMIAISGTLGNLWHAPTHCIRFAFHTSLCTAEGLKRPDLLRYPYRSEDVEVDKISVCGRTYLSIRVDVASLLDALSQRGAGELRPSSRIVLSLLFSRLSQVIKQLREFAGSTNTSKDGHEFFSPVNGVQSGTYTLATSIACKLLSGSRGSADLEKVIYGKELCDSLLNSGCIAEVPTPEDIIIQAFPLLLKLTEVARKAVRQSIRAAMALLPTQRLNDLVKNLLNSASSDSSIRRWFGVSYSTSNVDVWCYSLLIQLTIASEAPAAECADAVSSVVQSLRTETPCFAKVLVAEGETQRLLFFLLVLRDYYAYMAGNLLTDLQPVADAVATLAFEADGNVSASAVKTLLVITITEGRPFIQDYLNRWYSTNVHWRPRLLGFLGSLIQVAPLQSYISFSTMRELFLQAYDPHNPSRVERDACAMPALRLIGLAVTYLPNVSFQQQLQYLAVGNHDGVVQVIDLKTTGIIASFASHTEAILCVSYSSNTSSHDIAVLGEKMNQVKVWHGSRSTGVFGALFSGPTIEFRLRFVVDIPLLTTFDPVSCDLQLLVTKCKLKWLSPRCVELCTPVHDRLRLTVP